MQTSEKNIVTIYTESTPNPNSLKFVANFMLLEPGQHRDISDVKSAEGAPLAKAIFKEFSFVSSVFFMSNFVTVTKNDVGDWSESSGEVRTFIKSFLESEQPIINELSVETAPEKIAPVKEPVIKDEDLIVKIKSVLLDYVQPAVAMDGGAIDFSSYSQGTLVVSLRGSCSGCPSSTITLKSGIENLMKKMVPEVEQVVAENQ